MRVPSPIALIRRYATRAVLRRVALLLFAVVLLSGATTYGLYRKALAEIGPLDLEATKQLSVIVTCLLYTSPSQRD